VRSPTRSPNSSSTSHPCRARHGPTRESGLATPDRARGERTARRR